MFLFQGPAGSSSAVSPSNAPRAVLCCWLPLSHVPRRLKVGGAYFATCRDAGTAAATAVLINSSEWARRVGALTSHDPTVRGRSHLNAVSRDFHDITVVALKTLSAEMTVDSSGFTVLSVLTAEWFWRASLAGAESP